MSSKMEEIIARRKEKKLETFEDDFGSGSINDTKKKLISNNSTMTMSIDELKPFSDYDTSYNQFDYSDERFEELMKSIETTGGIIEPLIIWENENHEYIILSGKHRWLALKKLSEKVLKYKEVPVVLKKDIGIDEAVFIFNTSNMTRRSFESMGAYQKAAALSQIADSFKKIMEKRIKEDLGNKQNVSAGGKVTDLFNNCGITKTTHTGDNTEGIKLILSTIDDNFNGLCFANLNDFDSKYGHRRDIKGYAEAIKNFDDYLDLIKNKLDKDDLV